MDLPASPHGVPRRGIGRPGAGVRMERRDGLLRKTLYDTVPDRTDYGVLPEANRPVVEALDYFIVENVRSARRFLGRGGMGRTVEELTFVECNEHTRPEELPSMLEPLFGGRDAGFISEAGVPGVADPGAEIAALCHRAGIRVVPLVGPSSILLALMASGRTGSRLLSTAIFPSSRRSGQKPCGCMKKGHWVRDSRSSSSKRPTAMRNCWRRCSQCFRLIRA